MSILVVRESLDSLAEYARIPIVFEIASVLDVAASDPPGEGFVLAERPITPRRIKDYDAVPTEGPMAWPHRFDMSKWTIFAAYVDGVRAGGAAVVTRSPEIELLEGRTDIVLLWDIRVAPGARRRGVGAALLGAIASWARSGGVQWIKAETQNNNVAACRFYERHGFRLRAAHPDVYPAFPEELQMLWYKDLGG